MNKNTIDKYHGLNMVVDKLLSTAYCYEPGRLTKKKCFKIFMAIRWQSIWFNYPWKDSTRKRL